MALLSVVLAAFHQEKRLVLFEPFWFKYYRVSLNFHVLLILRLSLRNDQKLYLDANRQVRQPLLPWPPFFLVSCAVRRGFRSLGPRLKHASLRATRLAPNSIPQYSIGGLVPLKVNDLPAAILDLLTRLTSVAVAGGGLRLVSALFRVLL